MIGVGVLKSEMTSAAGMLRLPHVRSCAARPVPAGGVVPSAGGVVPPGAGGAPEPPGVAPLPVTDETLGEPSFVPEEDELPPGAFGLPVPFVVPTTPEPLPAEPPGR